MFGRIKKFWDESRAEFRHLNWPTRKEAARLTAVVIGISLGLAAFLGLFDYIFRYALEHLVIK